MKKIRILLIEDNRLLRDGLKAMLKKQEDMNVVETVGNGENILAIMGKYKPEVLLLDLGLRSRSSLNLVKLVKKNFPGSKIIAMDLIPLQADVFEFVEAGVSGFILKDATIADFLKTIRSVVKGIQVLPPNLTGSLFSQIVDHAVREGKPKLKKAVQMTKREREVIGLLSNGMSNKEIGQKIRISTYTVKSHIHNIMEKLALHKRLEIANYSYSAETLKTISKSISMINN